MPDCIKATYPIAATRVVKSDNDKIANTTTDISVDPTVKTEEPPAE